MNIQEKLKNFDYSLEEDVLLEEEKNILKIKVF
jgi:hypothetical protein